MKKIKKNISESAQPQPAKLPLTDEQIRQRAHEIYLARGGVNGMALDDWLKAEQELKQGNSI